MDQHNKKLLLTCGGIAAIVLVFVLTLGLIGLFFFDKLSDRLPGLHSEDTSEMIMTPSEIESIRRIGQWEFMAINDEELVDTVRKGFFSDDHLVRIMAPSAWDWTSATLTPHVSPGTRTRWQYVCHRSRYSTTISLTRHVHSRSTSRAHGQTKTGRRSTSGLVIR